MAWSAIVCDRTGGPLGELRDADNRRLSYALRRHSTLSFELSLRSKLAAALADTDVLVKVYESDPAFVAMFGAEDQLRFVGEVVDAEETATEGRASLAVTCADPAWALVDRLIGKTPEGYTQTAARGIIAADLLAWTNAESNTLLRLGAIETTVGTTVTGWRYKPISEAIQELAAPLDGFDWWVTPIEPTTDGSGLYVGLLNIVPARGATAVDAIFEFGTGRHNVRAYRRPVTKQGMLNRAIALPPPAGVADAPPGDPSVAEDTASQATWRLREGVVSSEISDPVLRQRLVDEHVRVRAQPRQTITFDPQPYGYRHNGKVVPVPRYKVDYDDGDIVPFRAVHGDVVRVDGTFRVRGVDLTISANGIATPSPTLTAT